MNLKYIIDRMARNADVIRGLAEGIDDTQARWRPAPERWSVLEVVNHLYDEEREDFRQRLRLTLEHPGTPWPPIDPPRWVTDRRYNERDPKESIERFIVEREESLQWLRGLENPDWNAVYVHPLGPITAGDLMASWLAHDFLHIRQLARLHWEYAAILTAPHANGYAGPW